MATFFIEQFGCRATQADAAAIAALERREDEAARVNPEAAFVVSDVEYR